jgi:branched-chain amino acid transport system substrate-binding protein
MDNSSDNSLQTYYTRRKKMRRLLVFMSFLFVSVTCASLGVPPALSKTLTVANLVPMSGSGAAWGLAGDRGVRMAVEEINAGGGLKVGKETYTIHVVTMDHRYAPVEALGAAKKVVRDGIKFAFGIGGGVMPSVQPVLEENKVLYMCQMGAGVEFTNARYPYTFRLMPSSELAYNLVLPKLVKMLGPIKIGFLHNNDELGRADTKVQEKVIRDLNLPIEKVSEFVERDSIDFSPVVTRFMAKGVNLVLDELAAAQAATFIKQAEEFGYKGRIGIVRAGHSVEKLFAQVGKRAMEGFIDGVNWPPDKLPSAKFQKVRSKYLSLYKEEPTGNFFDMHTGVEFFAAGVEKAGTLDSERIVKVLYDLETETVQGPTCMVGKSLGYGIKTQVSYGIPFSEVRDGRLKLIEVLRYKE